ncbi:MAG: GerMN domain-containing protein [Spirochaetaceae bacterium]|nr:GerMN domain-containing protein [Spirochaetaceae bacterium]
MSNRSLVFWRRLRAFLLLAGLGAYTAREAANAPSARRTFVFYAIGDNRLMVEDRMLPRLASEELAIQRYVEEALLGPVSPRAAPLFYKEARLRSLLYRDAVVYADLSEEAALPALEEGRPKDGEVLRSLHGLDAGIRRNFPAVQEVRLFINGRRVLPAAR